MCNNNLTIKKDLSDQKFVTKDSHIFFFLYTNDENHYEEKFSNQKTVRDIGSDARQDIYSTDSRINEKILKENYNYEILITDLNDSPDSGKIYSVFLLMPSDPNMKFDVRDFAKTESCPKEKFIYPESETYKSIVSIVNKFTNKNDKYYVIVETSPNEQHTMPNMFDHLFFNQKNSSASDLGMDVAFGLVYIPGKEADLIEFHDHYVLDDDKRLKSENREVLMKLPDSILIKKTFHMGSQQAFQTKKIK